MILRLSAYRSRHGRSVAHVGRGVIALCARTWSQIWILIEQKGHSGTQSFWVRGRASSSPLWQMNVFFSIFFVAKNTKRIDSWDLPLSETQLFLCQRLEWYMARWDSQFLKNTEQYNRVRFTPFRGPQCRRLKSSIMDSHSHFWCSHVNNFFCQKNRIV